MQAHLLFEDGCFNFKMPDDATIVPCGEYDNGLLKNGLHQAYNHFVQEAKLVLEALENRNGDGALLNETTYASAQAINDTLWLMDITDLQVLPFLLLTL
jgi:hypothetical protein